MKKIAVILADGFEDLEALTPVDLIRRCDDCICTTVGVNSGNVTSSHGVSVLADTTVYNVNFNAYDAIILPGGMPGAKNIASCSLVMQAVKCFLDNGKGIKTDDFCNEMIKIGNSSKKRTKNLGYKGIGRLSGVPYCKKRKTGSCTGGYY